MLAHMACYPTALLRCAYVLYFCWGSLPLPAQDSSTAPLAWVDSDEPPDKLPLQGSPLRARFPAELEQTTDIGWGILQYVLDDKGNVLKTDIYATDPAYFNALREAQNSLGRFKPALRAGRAVNSRVRLVELFNPASASTEGPDATARLLMATLVGDPTLVPERNQPPLQSKVIWVTVGLSEKGTVVSLRDAPDPLRASVDAATAAWRFAPARKAGKAIASELRVPFILVPVYRYPDANEVPPRRVSVTPPIYPTAMRSSGLRGDVHLAFSVDIEGRVRNPVVLKSLNPGFNQAAIEAIRRWKFEPARAAGVPIQYRAEQKIGFRLDDEEGGGGDGMEIKRTANQANLPEALRYDVAPEITSTVAPVYPYALLRDGVKGKASVTVLINPLGRVARTKVSKADQIELGYALQAAAEWFEYEPARKAARPTDALIVIEQSFATTNETLVSKADRALLKIEQKQPERILDSGQLDVPLQPVSTAMPIYPRSLIDSAVAGEAVVEVLVDEQGSVRLPRVVSATRPEFGYAAVQAVSAWRFNTPISQGKPSVARIRIPMNFPAIVNSAKTPPLKAGSGDEVSE